MGQMVQLGALSLEPRKYNAPLKVKQDKPAYGVAGKGFFDDKDILWNPGQALYFEGEPNLDLFPLNKLAWEKMQEFLNKLDSCGLKKAKKEGKEYVPYPRTEWSDDGEVFDMPMPERVMGVERIGKNEAIRT